MPRYSVKTAKGPEEAVEEAKAFFGEGGLGLEIASETPCCITLQGGGGHVTVTTSNEEDKTEVDLETREWDYHVKQFMRQIG